MSEVSQRPPRANERGLGRGLGALIPRADVGARELQVSSIRPNPRQPRMHFDPEQLEELAQSIREHGLLQPVLVSQQPDGTFQLVTGERRWRASQLAGLSTIPAMVKETTPQSSLEIALVENIQRSDLNALEEAHAYRSLLDEHGLTQEGLAQRIGKSRVAITNTLRLLQLPAEAQDALINGAITEGHARAVLMAVSEPDRVRVLRRVVDGHLSVRETEALARAMNSPVPLTSSEPPDPEVERIEDLFRQALGTRVRLLRSRNGGGRLVIHYFSEDELDGIYEVVLRGTGA